LIKTINRNRETIFITKSDKIIRHGSYNAILSPEFYWIKKVELPVKSVKAALKLAPSIFEDSLPKDGNYRYEARRDGDKFILIAYDPTKLESDLDRIFLSKKEVKSIYFAQDVLKSIDECTSVNESVALLNIDGVLVQVPQKCINSSSKLLSHIDSAKLDAKKVKLSSASLGEGSFVDSSMLLWAGVALIIFTISNIVDIFGYKRDISALESQREAILKKSRLPSTTFQLKSIKKRLDREFKYQKSVRDLLYKLSKLNLNKSEYIDSLEVRGDSLDVEISLKDKNRAKAIESFLKREFKVVSSNLSDGKLKVKLAL
jgi:hypothetical protein